MSLNGNLRDFTFAQLLNLINLARKTGTLYIEAPGQFASISFRDGQLAYAQIGREPSSLSNILFQAKKITAVQHGTFKIRAEKTSDKELGLLLVNANYITQEEILQSLQEYFANIVKSLFTWGEGLFQFDSDKLPPEDKITIRLPLENIIIEGSRQLDEWQQLQDKIPSLDMALKFIDDASKANLHNVNLSVAEWRVVRFINSKNTIYQIARTTYMNDLEIRRVVYKLIKAGLVEMIYPEGEKTLLGGEPSTMTADKGAQTSLLKRLLHRIRSLFGLTTLF
jgi:hypothetical protein